MSTPQGVPAVVRVDLIRENKDALRTVNRQDEVYLGLVDSVRRNGILNPPSVRKLTDPVTNEEFFGLVDGLHRFNAAKDAGLTEIPVLVLSLSDAQVLEAQIIANVHKVETKAMDYTKQLIRILNLNPLLTKAQLCDMLSKSPAWLDGRLSLLELVPDIQVLVNEGKLNVSNAIMLAKLPAEEQPTFLDSALSKSPQEFIPQASERVKQIREAKRKGKDPSKPEFTPVTHIRKLSELKEEVEKKELAKVLTKNVASVEDAFTLGVRWALSIDPMSIEQQRQKYEQEKINKEEEKKKRAKEREEKKAKEAAEISAQLSV